MIVIKHGRLFFKNSSFFKKLQCGILSGPETGRSFRATFWFVFTKPRPTPSACVVASWEKGFCPLLTGNEFDRRPELLVLWLEFPMYGNDLIPEFSRLQSELQSLGL